MISEWLKEKLCYDEVEDSLNKALLFYGDKLTKDFLSADSNLLLNDKKARRTLGTFTPFISYSGKIVSFGKV